MANAIVIPGLKTIDPIQGLVDYVDDIKPYHTKVFEVLTTYVYMDYLNVTITDTLNLNVDINNADGLDVTFTETSFTESLEFFASAGDQPKYTITVTSSTEITIPGDVTNQIYSNGVLTDSNGANFLVGTSIYDLSTNKTTITLNTTTYALTGPLVGPGTITPPTYAFQYPIQQAIPQGGVSVSDPAVPSRVFTNAVFLVDLNVSQAIQPGFVFEVTGGTPNDNTYYCVYLLFDPLTNVSTIGVSSTRVTAMNAEGFVSNVIINGKAITTGYDSPYDELYDQQAGSRIIYPGP